MPVVLSLRKRFHHSTEHIADNRAEQYQNSDDDDRHQDKNQPVLKKALPLFAWQKEHFFPLSCYYKQQKDDKYMDHYTPDAAFCHVLEPHT